MQTTLLPALMRRSAVQARFVLAGCLCLLAGLQVVIVGQAAAVEEAHGFSRMADLVPAFLQRGLGDKSILLVTFKGTVALGYFHPVVAMLIAVLGIYFVTEVAHEVESGLVDVMLARSLPRHVVVTRSLLLAVFAVIAATLLMAAGTQLGLRLFGSPAFEPPSGAVIASMLMHLGGVALCFAGFGLAVAAGARRWSTAFTIAALTAVLLYLLDFLAIGWPAFRWIAWISPFHYYPALSILAGDAPAWRNLIVLLSTAAAFTALGYWQFSRRDL